MLMKLQWGLTLSSSWWARCKETERISGNFLCMSESAILQVRVHSIRLQVRNQPTNYSSDPSLRWWMDVRTGAAVQHHGLVVLVQVIFDLFSKKKGHIWPLAQRLRVGNVNPHSARRQAEAASQNLRAGRAWRHPSPSPHTHPHSCSTAWQQELHCTGKANSSERFHVDVFKIAT